MDFELEDNEYRIARRALFARQRRLVWVLSLGGLIPFFACVLVLLALGITNPVADPAIAIFRNYSVVILSFLGGIRWGHAILHSHDEGSNIQLAPLSISVVPALIAWATMFLSNAPALALLLLALFLLPPPPLRLLLRFLLLVLLVLLPTGQLFIIPSCIE